MHRPRFSRLILFGLIALALASTWIPNASVQAAAGDLDPSFGSGGKVTTDFFGEYDSVTGLDIQADGKIVGAGVTSKRNSFLSTFFDFGLARYNPDGSLDTTFGTRGKVVTDFVGSDDGISDMVLQKDGKILVLGFVTTHEDLYANALVRYNIDGSFDRVSIHQLRRLDHRRHGHPDEAGQHHHAATQLQRPETDCDD